MPKPRKTVQRYMERDRTVESGKLPHVRKAVPLALLCADIHLSHKPPIARSGEPDWYKAQERYLSQLFPLVKKLVGEWEGEFPIICAGDIFDDGWRAHKCPPELINFADSVIPHIYAVPGNHDLPHHRYEDRGKSAYITLAKTRTITDIHTNTKIHPSMEIESKGYTLRLWGFPYGTPIAPHENKSGLVIDIAVVHDYCWIKGCEYPDAPAEKKAAKFAAKLKGYDVAVFGDNHQPFEVKYTNGLTLFNAGCLIPRRSDERKIKPSVGILYSDNTIKRHYLDTSQDVWLDLAAVPAAQMIGFETLIESLSGLGSASIDFTDTVKRLMEREKVGKEVKQLIISYLEGIK